MTRDFWRYGGSLRSGSIEGLLEGLCSMVFRVYMDNERVDEVHVRRDIGRQYSGYVVEAVKALNPLQIFSVNQVVTKAEPYIVDGDGLGIRFGRGDPQQVEFRIRKSKLTLHAPEPDIYEVEAQEYFRVRRLATAALEEACK